MNLVLRCIDFLRECVRRLRAGEALGSAAALLGELMDRERGSDDASSTTAPAGPSDPSADASPALPAPPRHVEDAYRLVVRFEPDLMLVDLKARLILSRLANLGEVIAHRPSNDELDRLENLTELEVILSTEQGDDTIRAAADVDGVTDVALAPAGAEPEPAAPETPPVASPAESAVEETGDDESTAETSPEPPPAVEPERPAAERDAAAAPGAGRPAVVPGGSKGAGTMRVDIERLDHLLNLAGELVVNRARFVQVAGEVVPALTQRHATNRMREFGDSLRRTLERLRATKNGEWAGEIEELAAGLELIEEQTRVWDDGRKGLARIGEAIDQLSRISDSLQQGVLDTRMVPVAPLFNRFKRVVRDLAQERGKKVDLVIRGEKTELDKHMIDELGEPLVHLVRNSIDHGLEAPDVRQARGKGESGTITLEASHRGNNVFIRIADDGGGIDVERIRAKVVERGLLTEAAAAALSPSAALEYIWDPGFSTAAEVTDLSGRGVGMDAVKTRVNELNGTVDVETTPDVGTVFAIRLPLTLAIINSLLVRARNIVFSMPIEDVREIVAVPAGDVVNVLGKQTIDVRGEFIPLVGITDVFDWRDLDAAPALPTEGPVHAVVLRSGPRVMALRVDELIGSEDIVIKSLSENFVHIRGLSGASILGDGGVCLMLDVATLMDLAIDRSKQERPS